jgi:hypothetical protein
MTKEQLYRGYKIVDLGTLTMVVDPSDEKDVKIMSSRDGCFDWIDGQYGDRLSCRESYIERTRPRAIALGAGRPDRDKVIGHDDMVDLKIALESGSVDLFLQHI